MTDTSDKSSKLNIRRYLQPYTPTSKEVTKSFYVNAQEYAAICAWTKKNDAIVLERQRKEKSEEEFNRQTQGGKYPYYGAIGGGVTYKFSPVPGSDNHTLVVTHTGASATLEVASRQFTNAPENYKELGFIKINFHTVMQELEPVMAKYAITSEEALFRAFEASVMSTSIGSTAVLTDPNTQEEYNVTNYDAW